MIGSKDVVEYVNSKQCRCYILIKMIDGLETNCFALVTGFNP